MVRREWIVVLLLLSLGAIAGAHGEDEYVQTPPSEYELYFRGLTPEEQVTEFVTRFTEPSVQVDPPEFTVAWDTFREWTGLTAMPFFKKEFERLEFEYCAEEEWTNLRNQAPMNILALVSSMVWDGGHMGMTRRILEPSAEDIQWFVEEARDKISRYVEKYRRIDNMLRAHFLVLRMTDEHAVRAYLEADRSERIVMVYDSYVRGNPELETTVTLPENMVFDGFEGLATQPDPDPDPSAAP